MKRSTLEFSLDDLKRIFENGFKPVSDNSCRCLFEITISPEMESTILANKDYFVRGRIIKDNRRSTGAFGDG